MEFNKSSQNIIVDKSFAFSLNIIKFVEILATKHKFVIANQLLKPAESKNDFVHKMKIAAKEADETEYWLMLCNASEGYLSCENHIEECRDFIKILSKIIASSKSKLVR